MQLDPYRLIYANAAANREALSSCWSQADRDRYLLALFRDGVYSGDAVYSAPEWVELAQGGSVASKKAQ